MQADFAIMTMREDEFEALEKRFPLSPQRGTSGRLYGISEIQTKDGKNYTVAIRRCSEQGPNAAQQLAHDMISDLNPLLLLVVGIAGGVPDTDFTLGDVIVSSRIHDFSVNAYKPGEIQWDVRGGIHPLVTEIIDNLPMYNTSLKGWNTKDSIGIERPVLDITKFKEFDITQMTDQDKQSIFDGTPPESWQRKILNTLKWHFGSPPQRQSQPLYKSGSIASSGSLVRDVPILIQWLQDARGIRAVEMEVGGVSQAAQQLRQQYPVMTIRGISDIVGLTRDPAWTLYACHSASTFTYALLTSNSTIFDNLQRPNLAGGAFNQPSVSNAHPLSSGSSSATVQMDTSPVGAQKSGKDAPIQIYISYAAKDEELEEELETHLALLKYQKIISPWHGRRIGLGLEKDKEFDNHIDMAQIILLLVSPRFMASSYTDEQEMRRAMQRHTNGQARVVPILLRPTDLKGAPFSNLQGLPRNNKPVISWLDRDQAWLEVVGEIRSLCNEIRGAINASKMHKNAKQLTLQQKSELVEKLLACPTMRERSLRNRVVQELRFADSISRNADATNKDDVMDIVNRCLNFSDGLQQLIERIEYREENSLPMQQLRAFAQSLSGE